MTAPRYQDLAGDAVPVRRQPGVEIRVFSGASGGLTAPTKNIVPVTMVEIRLDQGTSVCQDLPANYNAVLVVLEGEGSIGAEPKSVATGDVAWLTRGDSGKASEVAIRATDKPLRALLYAGRPLHEAVVARGPFVMNTEAEIEQAYADYRAGRFGPI
jgi:redox-sensitive bicupin YhaK (pirin superfamily)